jgi:hypothetical protein
MVAFGGGLGVLGYVGLGPETSGGVAVSPAVFIEALSEGVSGSYDRYALFNIIGRLAEADDRAGVMRVAGDIDAPFHPKAGGHLLKNAFGQAFSTASISATITRHVWRTPTDSFWDRRYALPPYTVEIFRDVGSAQQYDGCQTNQLEFSLGPNAALRAKSTLIATAWRSVAPNVASFYTDVDILDFDTCSFQVGGIANQDVESFTMTFNNKLEGIATLSGRDTIYKIRRSGSPETRFQMTVGFESIDQLVAFRAQTETSLQLVANSGHAFNLTLPRVVYSAVPVGMGGGGRQMLQIDGMARFHQGSGTAFEIALDTTIAQY